MKHIYLIVFVMISFQILAQETQKTIETKFVEVAPKIDGILDDLAWENTNIATDFVMFKPVSGTPEPINIKTDVKIVYDNEAIYFGVYLHDDKPEEIPMEFQTRDNFGNADFFGIVLNPQNDGINQTEFFIMSSGNQNDAKVLPSGNEDWSWDAVWYSEVKIIEDGWIVEVKIPFSALRFSNENIQTWGINFHRRHQKTNDQYSWNFIPRDKGHIAQYDGLLTGIKDIEPPIRLSFSPYASASATEYKGDYISGWSAGMDLKYGISESFTLDATLIPDFRQVAFDNVVLNLGPFEQKYDEKRQFFTEGLDLFSKGDFFYTRRIGNAPVGMGSFEISDDEEVASNPNTVDMLNAIKVSGRTKKGLGIGVFNAVTEKTTATINRVESGEVVSSREVVTEPLANYNVLIFDQQFNKNSSVTFINTNVLRQGDFRDANVTAVLYDLKTKNNKYGVSGGLAMSNINDNNTFTSGFEGLFEIGKISGKHQFDMEFSFRDQDYTKNDLGYQRRNNYFNIQNSYSYRIFEPKGNFNNYGFYLWTNTGFMSKLDNSLASYKEKQNNYIGTESGVSLWGTTKKQLSFGINLNAGIGNQYDYYEPRVAGRFYKENGSVSLGSRVSTDRRKDFYTRARVFYRVRINNPETYLSASISPTYRISKHVGIGYQIEIDKAKDQKGYVNIIDDDIIFGNRNKLNIENSIYSKYNFNTKSSLGLTLRHYWSAVDYDENFYLLKYDGTLANHDYENNEDINFNLWNFDLSYSWEFAPGSQLSVLYRNSIFEAGTDPNLSFISNLENMFEEPLTNQLSLKLIYYLDYNQLKTWI